MLESDDVTMHGLSAMTHLFPEVGVDAGFLAKLMAVLISREDGAPQHMSRGQNSLQQRPSTKYKQTKAFQLENYAIHDFWDLMPCYLGTWTLWSLGPFTGAIISAPCRWVQDLVLIDFLEGWGGVEM